MKKHIEHISIALFAAVLLVWFGPSMLLATDPLPRPNVLFIAVDDLRSDLGALGVMHAKTPQLDAFASTARLFRRHYVNLAAGHPEVVRELLAHLQRMPNPTASKASKEAN